MSSSESMSHERARELLPWLANNSLSDEERELVDEHSRNCVSCRRDLAELERLQVSIAQTSDSIEIPVPDMRRINARIDALIENEHRSQKLVARMREFLFSPWRIAFAVQTVLLIAMGTVLFWPQSQEAEFTTLTNSNPINDGHYIRVVFDPHRDMVELSALVDTMNLTIVDGPSARGVATLRLSHTASDEDRDAMISNLLTEPGILFAEPATTGER